MGNFILKGDVDEHLFVSDNLKVKTIRLIETNENGDNYSFEIVSESEKKNHELIDGLLGKKISIEIKVLEE